MPSPRCRSTGPINAASPRGALLITPQIGRQTVSARVHECGEAPEPVPLPAAGVEQQRPQGKPTGRMYPLRLERPPRAGNRTCRPVQRSSHKYAAAKMLLVRYRCTVVGCCCSRRILGLAQLHTSKLSPPPLPPSTDQRTDLVPALWHELRVACGFVRINNNNNKNNGLTFTTTKATAAAKVNAHSDKWRWFARSQFSYPFYRLFGIFLWLTSALDPKPRLSTLTSCAGANV